MVKLYVKRILAKQMTLNEVPEKWRAEVAKELGVELATPTDL